MPYIKQMWRPEYRLVIKKIRDNPGTAVKWALIASKYKNVEEIDGCINYIITQIIRNRNYITEKEREFIMDIIIEVYSKPLSYFCINRFNGLITSIIDELQERRWDTATNISFLIGVRLLFKETFTNDYEKRKRKENGDLEGIEE